MAEERTQRRLAAILVADVVGYSRLMRADEAGTLAQLKTLRKELFDPKISEYGGRVVKTTGDGFLVEFPSAVDAVQHAVDVQQAMARRNADIAESQRMEIRMGINVGDVIVEDDDLFGDGVNVAARLEGLAEPGGICISGNAYEQVRDKAPVGFEDMGDQQVKNIDRPVRAYRASLEDDTVSTLSRGSDAAPPLPDKPSIAVLPFENMSGDPEQEYFSDGITEDIITALSHIRQFRVVSRNSTFSFKGQSPDTRKVARELDARYIVEGSLRKAGERIRLTAQLIDGATGNHLWAERYDRNLSNIFDLQDELTQTLVGAIEPELSKAEQGMASVKSPELLSAWDAYQRGMWHMHKMKPDDFAAAKSFFEQAIALDSGFGSAYSGLASVLFYQGYYGATSSWKDTGDTALVAAKKALELDNDDANAHAALSRVHQLRRELKLVIVEAKEAIRLNPSLAEAYHGLGRAYLHSGDAEEGLIQFNAAIKLSPNDPHAAQYVGGRAMSHLYLRQHEEAVEWAAKAIRFPNAFWPVRAVLASALGHLDRKAEAKQAVDDLLQFRPGISLAFVRETVPTDDQDYMDHLLTGLSKAGLPE
jgi:adenylate cyclase